MSDRKSQSLLCSGRAFPTNQIRKNEVIVIEKSVAFDFSFFNLLNEPFLLVVSDHPYFVGVQYHPEFTSRPIKPSPPYFGLLLAAAGKLNSYLQRGCQLSPRYKATPITLSILKPH